MSFLLFVLGTLWRLGCRIDRLCKNLLDENMAVYKTRHQIIEHPFGTIKRSWVYTYTLLKGIEKVNGEMAIIFTMYNIRRDMSIIGLKELIGRLKEGKESQKAKKALVISSIKMYERYRMVIAA